MLERSLPAFLNAFKEKGLTLSPKFVSTRMQVALNWARAGKAVALAPKSAAEELGFTDLAEKTVSDSDLLVPAMTIVTQKSKYRSHIVNNFLKDRSRTPEGQAHRVHVRQGNAGRTGFHPGTENLKRKTL